MQNDLNDKDLKIEIIDKRYRNFILVLYEDSNSYNFHDVMQIIKSNKYWAYIKHIAEKEETKEHYHVFLQLENACTIETLGKRLNVPVNYIQKVMSVRASCRYLIHKDNDDKIQYNISDVKVSPLFERKFNLQFDDLKSEEEQINDIYLFIDNLPSDKFSECLRYLILFINKNCYDRVYKRYRQEFIDFLKDKCYN